MTSTQPVPSYEPKHMIRVLEIPTDFNCEFRNSIIEIILLWGPTILEIIMFQIKTGVRYFRFSHFRRFFGL